MRLQRVALKYIKDNYVSLLTDLFLTADVSYKPFWR